MTYPAQTCEYVSKPLNCNQIGKKSYMFPPIAIIKATKK